MPLSKLVAITRRLCRRVDGLRFSPPTAYIYNPLSYARAAHEAYLDAYGEGTGRVLLLGMNPGPFGMMQTGVPFGDVCMVRDFLGIESTVKRPAVEHPSRPILGFQSTRREVSGTRLWGWAQQRFGTPRAFFGRFFVLNYCPLAFLEAGGKNRTPDKLPVSEQAPLLAACDQTLVDWVDATRPSLVVGVGAFAGLRARLSLGDRVAVGTILHPSPANPKANAGWASIVERQLRDLGVRV